MVAPGGSLKTKEKSIKSLIIKNYRGFLFFLAGSRK